MEPQVAFYRLNRKVVNHQDDIPADARQVIYYSLAIGHHVGVMDCFSEMMVVPVDIYKRCLDRLPEGEGRRKLEGALKWKEIEINRSHVDELLPAFKTLSGYISDPETQWVQIMLKCLQEMVAEPALYLMIKIRE